MNLEALKQIPIVSVMEHHGFGMARKSGDSLFYMAPWRQERTASVKVSIKNNLFIDFGDNSYRGSVIDLVMHLEHCDIQNALAWLEKFGGQSIPMPIKKMEFNPSDAAPLHQEPEISPAFVVKDVSLINDKNLKQYIRYDRNVSLEIAQRFLKELEIEHSVTHKNYRVVGMENQSGGWEVRGIHGNFKCCVGHKDFSFLDTESENLLVVEGMFDLLSAITIEQRLQLPKASYLVLHSLSMVEKAKAVMDQHPQVLLALDHDSAGRKSTKLLLERDKRYVDIASRYTMRQGKDLNDYLRKEVSVSHKRRLRM